MTIGAPADPEHVVKLLGEHRDPIERRGEAEVVLSGRTFCLRKQFLDDIAQQPQAERVGRLGAALLVMHSPVDELVGVDNARRIFDTARHPKSFIALDGADHLLTDRRDAEFVATILAAWAGRYLLKRGAVEKNCREGTFRDTGNWRPGPGCGQNRRSLSSVSERGSEMPEATSDHNGLLTVLGISPRELDSLLKFVDVRICAEGCDNTLRHAEHWAEANDVGWPRLAAGLAESGAYCDCEIVANTAAFFGAA